MNLGQNLETDCVVKLLYELSQGEQVDDDNHTAALDNAVTALGKLIGASERPAVATAILRLSARPQPSDNHTYRVRAALIRGGWVIPNNPPTT